MTADERLLDARKGIWSSQVHNLKAQINGLRQRIASTPDELRKPLMALCERLKEAEKQLNEVEYSLDEDIRQQMKHQSQMEPDKCPI